MTDDFNIICSKIEDEKEFLNTVSQEIWRKPELMYKEFNAHALLSNTFKNLGFEVQKNYFLDTAFKAEYFSKKGQFSGPTVAILLEYDALPEIGHACGHNLISEAGLAAAIAVKEVMDKDPALPGKLVVMGTPAEETGGGKIKLIQKEAFKDIDVALMVHPSIISCASPSPSCMLNGSIEYVGKEAHAGHASWLGLNALDAAVLCYNNISVLRQQIRQDHKVNVILKESGVATNIIPAKSLLEICIRTPNMTEIRELLSRVQMCINGAAIATGCEVSYQFDESNCYQNIISNKVLINLFRKYFVKLGMELQETPSGATSDMGNVSHIVPAYHPMYSIPTKGVNHTKEFADAAGLPTAQESTLAAAKAMAMTAVSVLRNPDTMKAVKTQFELDTLNEKLADN